MKKSTIEPNADPILEAERLLDICEPDEQDKILALLVHVAQRQQARIERLEELVRELNPGADL